MSMAWRRHRTPPRPDQLNQGLGAAQGLRGQKCGRSGEGRRGSVRQRRAAGPLWWKLVAP